MREQQIATAVPLSQLLLSTTTGETRHPFNGTITLAKNPLPCDAPQTHIRSHTSHIKGKQASNHKTLNSPITPS
ncbi:hypothetical protein BDN71DRAFT_1457085 [Pleurotus eryngii]|uniref:Uncharacterized protein n=1 Tax=Pleurotus eryngii TaxID=5323 RepID=A0A9P6DAE0_PLEER|nr:hypothetical protein BDN71DRAFT_1457085 [Pleurotus eryngii]